ncbi:glycosyltransferase involved in cell wall biosynthesis [Algoriphagus boseongensis]|uniref:Glycosyltransferase involved in cell wall biosynthesis n=1 Tax=Algoriphagus boseongensis TaxID=1442587 RepID=A0A4R6T8L4_9BACT|nr:glycosyltransferase family 2 protein [Algoriphagus boseongensis]TDQ17237.1 glycosyltransferase involved in cell wall biosynthesis [Algoriphagus boseongensis]
MNAPPKVIGFVPVYKAEKFISKTLEALAAQTYSNFEILVCDDNSPDNSASICKEFCSSDSRFKFTQNTENLGWFKTSEMLWMQAANKSKYCFTNPHDDLPYPNYISELVELLEKNPKASIAIPGMANQRPDETVVSFYEDASDIEDVVERCFRIAKKDKDYWWAAFHGLHRSEFVEKIYPIDKLRFGESEFSLDLISFLKMGFFGPLVTSNQVLLKKVYLEKSVSHNWRHNSKNKSALWLAIFKEIENSHLDLNSKIKLQKKLSLLLFSRLTGRFQNLFK